MRQEVPSYQKPAWQQFSFICIISILGIVLVKKAFSLSITSFLLLTGLSYFLLGLLIGDLGWGFFSAHSKTLFLKTNWLLRLPFSVVTRVMSGGSSGKSHPVPFAEMVGEAPDEVETAPGRPSVAQTLSIAPTTGRFSPSPSSRALPISQAVRPGSSLPPELSLLARVEAEHRIHSSRQSSQRHSLSGADEQEGGNQQDRGKQRVPLLAVFDKPYFQRQQHQQASRISHTSISRASSPASSVQASAAVPRLTPRGNGSEVAAVLSQATTEFQPRKMSPSRHHPNAMIAALVDAHGVGRS